jgi:hypothetical protein
VTLTNTGTGRLTINEIKVGGTGFVGIFGGGSSQDFILVSKDCPSALEANASCTARVIFAPQKVGNLSGNLNVFSGSSIVPMQVHLSGVGTPPDIIQ